MKLLGNSIPWGKMHFRLMRLALAPFGKEIVNNDF